MKFVCPECGRERSGPGLCSVDSTPVARTDDDLLGVTIGSYRVTRILGVGGMGRVYQAVHPTIGSRVAIKVLLRHGDELVRRFFAEARAVNVIRHEHIVNILDLATLPDGRPYIVMEYLDGQPLSALIAESGALAPATIGRIGGQMLDALAAAHAHKIVHRDLKPDNVFITPTGNVKVLDFGIAKLDRADSGPGLPTREGAILGTPLYTSPEQAQGKPVDARADLYSLGVILYEAATGRRPFMADSLYEILRLHIEEPPMPPRLVRPDLAPAMDALILRALEKDPARRFQSASEMAGALAAATGVARAEAAPPRDPSLRQVHTKPFAPPFPWPALFVVAGLAILGTGTYFGVRGMREHEGQPVVAKIPARPADEPPHEASDLQKLERKLRVYIDCLDDVSSSARYARTWYLAWANPKAGPSGHELNNYGVGVLDSAKPCADAVRAAAHAPPSLPAIEDPAGRFATAALAVAEVEAAAHAYYHDGDYKDDHMRKGIALHPRLLAGWDDLAKADGALRPEVKSASRRAHEDRLAAEDAGGRKLIYWLARLMLAAEPLVELCDVPATAVTQIDLAKLMPLLGAYEKALEELGAFEAAHPPGDENHGDTTLYLHDLDRTSKELDVSAKELMRRVRDHRPIGGFEREHLNPDMVDGSPGQVTTRYNSLVHAARAFEYWTLAIPIQMR